MLSTGEGELTVGQERGTISVMCRWVVLFAIAGLLGLSAWAQSAEDWPQPQSGQDQAQQPPPASKTPPPRSDDSKDDTVSSSKHTKIDLSPPPGDASHPGSAAASDVNEFHVYDPHKAAKDVEVGDYYLKRKNYPAAISRYRGALQWKPNDALATIGLARALDKSGQLEDARESYQDYLRILPHGPSAEEAANAVQRLTLESKSGNDADKPRR